MNPMTMASLGECMSANTTAAEKSDRAPRKRMARGVDRPQYLQPEDVDKVMMMVVALMSEVSALRERVDTHEVLAGQGKLGTLDEIQAFELTDERRAVREEARQAMLKRVLRVVMAERESAPTNHKV